MSHGANSTSSCLSSPLAHFPSPQEEEFTIRASGVPCSMQVRPGPQLHHLEHNDPAMIRWMYGVTTKDQVSSQHLLERMQLDNLAKVLRTRRLRWHSHVERSNSWLKKVQKLNPTGGRGRGHPKKSWTVVINMDCLGLAATQPSDRKAWSGRFRMMFCCGYK